MCEADLMEGSMKKVISSSVAAGVTNSNDDANARLIAAAPELLAACEEVFALLDTTHRWTDEYKTLKAALAKAKGA